MQHFKHMSPEASRFYTRCINEVLLNIYAVQQGHFEKYIQEIKSEEDHKLWKMILPTMIALMENRLS